MEVNVPSQGFWCEGGNVPSQEFVFLNVLDAIHDFLHVQNICIFPVFSPVTDLQVDIFGEGLQDSK